MNKHADLIRQYADDWAETNAPWERWEYKSRVGWLAVNDHPSWAQDIEYRRKPRTITINGYEVPEPVRKPLEECQAYFVPMISSEFIKIDCRLWDQNIYSMIVLKAGLIHLTYEAAELHRKALLSFTEVTK